MRYVDIKQRGGEGVKNGLLTCSFSDLCADHSAVLA